MKWQKGQKVRLAKTAGISKQYLNSILRGDSPANMRLARELERASKELGIFISRYDWAESDITENLLFHNSINQNK